MSDDEYVPSTHSDEGYDAGPSTARVYPLPRTTFRSIEYPGPMQRPDQILKVVSQDEIDECFNAPISEPRVLEMRYRPDVRSAIPVRGNRAASQKLLVKVTRRRRKARAGHVQPPDGEGVFTTEVLGSVPQTVRFRSMADYQYTPPDSHVTQLVQSLADLDYDAILDYQVPPLNEEYFEAAPLNDDGSKPAIPFVSKMALQPTPGFSSRVLPYNFNYRMGPQTVEEEVWDDDAQETRKRYVNRSRAQGWSVQAIGHGHAVPTGPEAAIKEREGKLNQELLSRLRHIFDARPVWLRYALLSHFNEKERYEIESNKLYLPAVAFTYGAGPYWKCLVRFGYDPCADPGAHKYQRVYVYLDVKRGRNNVLNTAPDYEEEEEAKRPSHWWEHEQNARIAQGLRPPIDETKQYIFDGQILHRNRPDYQLIDMHDPFIAKYIYDPVNLTDTCDHHSGWYRPVAFELIKALLRQRFAHLRDTNEPPTDATCAGIVDAYERALDERDDKEAAEAFGRRIAATRRAQQ